MPYTAKQKGFFGADLGRMEEGKPTRTGMTKTQLVEGIHAPTKESSRLARHSKKHGKRFSHRSG